MRYQALRNIGMPGGLGIFEVGQELTAEQLAGCDVNYLVANGSLEVLDGVAEEAKAAAKDLKAQLKSAKDELKAAQAALEPFKARNDELATKLAEAEALIGVLTDEEKAELNKRLSK